MAAGRDEVRTTVGAMASQGTHQPSFAECRKSARVVREAPLGKEALDTVRPRGVSGLFRSRAPLAFQLRLAARQDRLLWWSPQIFALLEPPGNDPARGGSRWLRWLDRWWDLLLFAVPPVALLGAAALLALPPGAARWRLIAALVCGLVVLGYVTALMTAVVVRGFLSLYRTLILGRSEEVTDFGIGQVLASHWSMPLCQLTDTDTVAGAVLDAVQERVADQVAAFPGGPKESVDVLCPEHGVTSSQGRAALHRDRRVSLFTQNPPVLVIRVNPTIPLSLPPAPPKVAGRLLLAIPWLVGGIAVVIAILAQFVAYWEREDCAQKPPARRVTECADQPRTYGDALYWLLNRLSGGDPEGLGAHTMYARSLGLLVTLMSVIVIGGVLTSLVRQAVARTQRFGQEVTSAYNETVRGVGASAGDAANPSNPVPRSHPGRPGTAGTPKPPDSQAPPRAEHGQNARVLAGFAAGLALGAVLTQRRRR
jgi:hypothetical protein